MKITLVTIVLFSVLFTVLAEAEFKEEPELEAFAAFDEDDEIQSSLVPSVGNPTFGKSSSSSSRTSTASIGRMILRKRVPNPKVSKTKGRKKCGCCKCKTKIIREQCPSEGDSCKMCRMGKTKIIIPVPVPIPGGGSNNSGGGSNNSGSGSNTPASTTAATTAAPTTTGATATSST